MDSVSCALVESVLDVQWKDVSRFHREVCSELVGSSASGGPLSGIVVGLQTQGDDKKETRNDNKP
eukprot:7297712-Ditylum_brightwellii.AAC.1